MTSAWKPPCRHVIPGGRHVWATAANYPRETDWWIQYWPFDHTRKQVSYIASKDQVVVCRFCLTQSSTPLVSLRYMDEFQFPWPAEATNTHSSQNSEQGKAECCRLFSGGVLLESHLADSYLFRCCFFYTRLWSTVTKETKHKICIAEHALSHIIIVNSTRACSKPRTNDGPDYS